MINDIIKILNLEDFIIDIESTTLLKENNVFYLSIQLTKLPSYVCENCGCICTKTHDYIKKTINHGLFSDNKLIIYYYARRIKCDSCGKRFYEHNPFSNKNENVSFYTIHKILETLKDFHVTFTHVANKYYLSKNQVLVIFDQYINCHRKKLPEVMCIDEFYKGKKSKQKYAFVMLDFSNSQITDILPTRKKDYLLKYFSSIPKAERQNVKYICMDMYDTYKIVAKYRFPNAKIAVDALCKTLHKLSILQLKRAHLENRLEQRIKFFSKYKLLIIDEVGFLPLDIESSNLLFQLIAKRYEKNSTIVTTNKPLSRWGEIFGDPVLANAIFDRLLHHSNVINIVGRSYRTKDIIEDDN